MGIVFTLIGLVIALIFGIQLLIIAFRQSVWWGLGFLFVPFVSLIFVIMHWEQTSKPFLLYLICIPFFVVGAILTPQPDIMSY